MFDQKLADDAQALIDKGVFKHSDWVELKNNGAAFAWGSLFPTFTAVIKNWHDEGLYYDYQTGSPKKPSQVRSIAVLVVVISIPFSCCCRLLLHSLIAKALLFSMLQSQSSNTKVPSRCNRKSRLSCITTLRVRSLIYFFHPSSLESDSNKKHKNLTRRCN